MVKEYCKYEEGDIYKSKYIPYQSALIGLKGKDFLLNHYSEAYIKSCEIFIDYFKDKKFDSLVIYPLVFNFRHAIELKLKSYIPIYNFVFCKKLELKRTHKLNIIWNEIKENILPKLNYKNSSYNRKIEIIDAIITDLLKFDKKGLNYRYPFDEELTKLEIINVKVLFEIIPTTFAILNEWDFELEVRWDKLVDKHS